MKHMKFFKCFYGNKGMIMEIVTTQKNRTMPIAFHHNVERRINFALNRFRHNIQRIHVRFDDSNGAKGRVGIRCSVLVNLLSHGIVVVQSKGVDAFSAFNSCIEKIVVTIKRKNTKERDIMIKNYRRKPRLIPQNF